MRGGICGVIFGGCLLVASGLFAQSDHQRTRYLETSDIPRAIPVEPEAPPARQSGATRSDTANDTARFLAGLKPSGSGPAAELASGAIWQQYAASLGAEWNNFDQRSWKRVRSWSAAELGRTDGTVFYPFSGPDFIYVYNLFPNASTYILCGLEPVGEIPDVSKLHSLGATLNSLQASMHTLLTAGYFVTKDMRAELHGGTLPIIYVLMARSGCTLLDVKRTGQTAQIHFTAQGESGTRTLIYIQGDLSDGGLHNSALLGTLRQMAPRYAYVKAASYLMHGSEFSAIRNTLLSQCHMIVQDDSGIPWRYFDPQKWTLRLYGTYTPPLNIFRQHYQSDLAQAYSRTLTKSLDFGAGYKWNPQEATLIVAVAK